jgi:hypothetical protein
VTAAIIGPRTMDQLTDLLAGATVTLTDDVLDQIDRIVPPGVTLNTPDAGWQPPSLTTAAHRRRPADSRSAASPAQREDFFVFGQFRDVFRPVSSLLSIRNLPKDVSPDPWGRPGARVTPDARGFTGAGVVSGAG